MSKILEVGWTVRWATFIQIWISQVLHLNGQERNHYDSSALTSYCGKNKNLLIIDEIQEIHPRHIDSIDKLLNQLSESKASILVIFRSPNPFNSIDLLL